jgi:transposase
MPKPYSQDLRDRVIDAAERGGMSRRAAARRYEISESVAIKWLERVERDGSRKPVGHLGRRRGFVRWNVGLKQQIQNQKFNS